MSTSVLMKETYRAERQIRPVAQSAAPAAQLPAVGWRVMGWAGLLFVLLGGLDLALAWYPLNFGSPEWEFGTLTTSFNNLPVPTVGVVLVLLSALMLRRRGLVRVTAVLLTLLALAVVGGAILYATTIPIALQSVPPGSVVMLGLKKAVAKTTGQTVLYLIAFAGLAVVAWRHSAKQ